MSVAVIVVIYLAGVVVIMTARAISEE